MAEKATGTMQLGLLALAMVFLSSMGHSDAVKLSKARRQRRGEFCLSQCVLIYIFSFRFAAFHLGVTDLPTFNKQSKDNILFILSSFTFVFHSGGYVRFHLSPEWLMFLTLFEIASLRLCIPFY